MSEWNWSAERRTAIGDVANQSLEYVAERLLESRKRAFEAERTAQSLQTELDALKTAHAWIKTSERLPPVEPGADLDVLAVVSIRIGETIDKTVTMVLNYCPGYPDEDDQWPWSAECCGVYGNDEVTHWMPLPEAPK